MKKQIYLIITNCYPTIHSNLKEAKKQVENIRKYVGADKSPDAMYCEFTEKDFKEKFCNCTFRKLI